MTALIVAARLTWNLVSGSLFISYPSVPVVQVCVNEVCFAPSNPVGDVLDWDGSAPIVRAECADGSWQVATWWPAYTG